MSRQRAKTRASSSNASTGAANNREEILLSAVKEFAERGYEGASTSSIARRAGVTQPLVHYHFGSKEKLWQEVIDHLFTDPRERFGRVPMELKDLRPRDLLRVLIRRFVRMCAERPEFLQIVLRESTVGGPRFDWMTEHHIAPLVAAVQNAIEATAGLADEADVPASHLLFIVMGAAQFLFTAPALFTAVTGLSPSDDAVIETHADAVVRAIEGMLQD